MNFLKSVWQKIKQWFSKDVQSKLKVNSMSDASVINNEVKPIQIVDGVANVISDPLQAQPQPIAPVQTGVLPSAANVNTVTTGTKTVAVNSGVPVKVARTLQDKISLYKKFKEVLGEDFDDVEADFINILDKLI
jgi:hypothetical protein